jgi:succinylarginine dihydrolase
MSAFELNLDSLVGPTHNYAGLSFGNLASQKFALTKSNPKQAALQGLAKMKFLHDLGVKQAVLPPHPRPNLRILERLGFAGDDAELLKQIESHPRLLAAVYSASAMWAANAATISPSSDSEDRLLHITPANLLTQFHRSLEPPCSANLLRQIFSDTNFFAHHEPLPASPIYADEGAANHMRMSATHSDPGIQIFVYGSDPLRPESSPSNFPARQTLQSVEALARLHQLDPERTIFAQQSPQAIDAGVFHNDVIAVANCDVLLCHAEAWADGDEIPKKIRSRFSVLYHRDPWIFIARSDELSLTDAVQSYIFNSQVVSLSDGTMAMIAPLECREHSGVQRFIARILAGGSPIRAVHYLDVRQSMQNGGGPACLRLRVVMNDEQFAHVHPGVIFSDELYARLVAWVQRHYRDELSTDDLRDPALVVECGEVINELEQILNIEIIPRD